jgi:hypothetical protein
MLVFAWHQYCAGLESDWFTSRYFIPEHCQSLPEDGNYFRIFDSEGVPASEKIRIDNNKFSPLLARIGAGGFFILSGATAQVRTDEGQLVDETMIGDDLLFARTLSCGLRHCAVSIDGLVVFLDSTDLQRQRTALTEEHLAPAPNQIVEPRGAAVACDQTDTCVVSWISLQRTSGGPSESYESLGVFAQAFDLASGDHSEKLRLVDPTEAYEEGVRLEAIGNGEFIVARRAGSNLSLTKLRVE